MPKKYASTISNGANIMLGANGIVGVFLLSVFRGNFVLAKVSLGLISVRCTELRCVCIAKVRNVLISGKINGEQVISPL